MLLAFETSCDETSAALVHHGRVLSNVVASQIALHAEYGGVVPELAARAHLQNLLPIARVALRQASVSTDKLDAVAATQGPGLPSALMVGLKAAQALAFALRRPFLGIHHHEAHLYSPWIRPNVALADQIRADGALTDRIGPNVAFADQIGANVAFADRIRANMAFADFSDFQPNVSLLVSGGHTMLVHVQAELRHRLLGSTVDDAAGECFDKVGKLLGLPYPAGPEMDRLAERGNPKAFDFPRPMLNESHDDFSFSGLKTSVRYFLRDHPAMLNDAQSIRDLCASVQAAIVEVLVAKTLRAARRLGVGCVTASGGVICNRALRRELTQACEREGLKLLLAEKSLCTDNAAMIGILAERKLRSCESETSLDADISPDWLLVSSESSRGSP